MNLFPFSKVMGATEPVTLMITDGPTKPTADEWHTDVTYAAEPPDSRASPGGGRARAGRRHPVGVDDGRLRGALAHHAGPARRARGPAQLRGVHRRCGGGGPPRRPVRGLRGGVSGDVPAGGPPARACQPRFRPARSVSQQLLHDRDRGHDRRGERCPAGHAAAPSGGPSVPLPVALAARATSPSGTNARRTIAASAITSPDPGRCAASRSEVRARSAHPSCSRPGRFDARSSRRERGEADSATNHWARGNGRDPGVRVSGIFVLEGVPSRRRSRGSASGERDQAVDDPRPSGVSE